MKRKPTAFHRHLFVEAWRLTWERKSLWVLGLFGGIALSGAVVEPVLSGLARVLGSADRWQYLHAEAAAAYVAPLSESVRRLASLPPLSTQVWLTLSIIIAVAGIWFLVLCQASLLAGLIEKKPHRLVDLLWRGNHSLWSLFVLDVVAFVTNALLLFMVAMPVLLYVTRPGWSEGFFAAFALLIYLPLAMGVRIMANFAAVQIVRRGYHVTHALEHAWYTFNTHWLAAFETGLMIALVTVAVTAASLVSLLLASLVFLLLLTVAAAGGWPILIALVTAAAVLAVGLVMLAIMGALTTFRFAVWAGFHGRASHPIIRYTLVAKLKRLFTM